jgi:Fe-S cluster biogenesis protein NfuA
MMRISRRKFVGLRAPCQLANSNFVFILFDRYDKALSKPYSIWWSYRATKHKEGDMKEKVEAALKKIRPMLQRDGGNVELIEVEDGIVKVRLQGACAGCPMSQMTIKNGIERLLKQEIPEVKSVVSV